MQCPTFMIKCSAQLSQKSYRVTIHKWNDQLKSFKVYSNKKVSTQTERWKCSEPPCGERSYSNCITLSDQDQVTQTTELAVRIGPGHLEPSQSVWVPSWARLVPTSGRCDILKSHIQINCMASCKPTTWLLANSLADDAVLCVKETSCVCVSGD